MAKWLFFVLENNSLYCSNGIKLIQLLIVDKPYQASDAAHVLKGVIIRTLKRILSSLSISTQRIKIAFAVCIREVILLKTPDSVPSRLTIGNRLAASSPHYLMVLLVFQMQDITTQRISKC